jgi:broad specificity phosphatase PhoE
MSPTPADRPRVFLVRHGETEWNAIDRLLSFTDLELNERGREQARRLGTELGAERMVFDRVLCSPLRRATETAALLLASSPGSPDVVLEPRLVEVDFGPLEGWTQDAILADPAAAAWRAGGAYPGVETDDSVLSRVASVWADLPVTGTTLVVGHGRFLRTLIASRVLDLPLSASTRMRMRNCRPAIVEPGETPLLLALNAGPPYRL